MVKASITREGVLVGVRIETNPNSRRLGYAELGTLAKELTKFGLP